MSGVAGLERMLALVRELPEQLAGAGDLVAGAALRPPARRPREVLLCGMGGSAAAADVVRPVLAEAGLRLSVRRDYGLPFWADRETLVVASSYSGGTEETLSAAAEARRRGCSLLVVASGGELVGLGADGLGVVTLPGGLPPRASLGHGVGALLWSLHALGLLADPGPAVAEAVRVLREGNDLHDGGSADPAAALARRCGRRFLVVYAAGPAAPPAARRLKAQVNENAKLPAAWAAFPELDHNDLVGWELAAERRQGFALLLLRDSVPDPRLEARIAATLDLLDGQFARRAEAGPRGGGLLARILSLVQLGDHLSCRLAEAGGVDPMPVRRIQTLKERLRGGGKP